MGELLQVGDLLPVGHDRGLGTKQSALGLQAYRSQMCFDGLFEFAFRLQAKMGSSRLQRMCSIVHLAGFPGLEEEELAEVWIQF